MFMPSHIRKNSNGFTISVCVSSKWHMLRIWLMFGIKVELRIMYVYNFIISISKNSFRLDLEIRMF